MKQTVFFVVGAIVVIGIVGVSQRAQGDETMSAEDAARELIAVSGIEDQLVPVMKQMIRLQAQAAEGVGMGFDTKALDRWVEENISWSDFEAGYIEIYTDLFTAEELMQLTAFQRSPVGRKSMELLPVIMERGGQLGLRVVQEKMPALMELLLEDKDLG